jgi:Rrf2 family protein
MLTISSKSVYCVHALFELALGYGDKLISIREIAEAQKIPEDYLRQLLIILKRANLVESVRGMKGGYRLAKHPSAIRVRDIMENIEGPMKLVTINPDDVSLSVFWGECGKKIQDIFNTSLEDLILEKQRIEKTITYYI